MCRISSNARRAAFAGWLVFTILVFTGCRQDMHDQPRYEPLEASDFFADGLSSRHPPEGTVARDALEGSAYFNTAKQDGELGTTLPFALTRDLLERGQERYNIYCSPCHDHVGTGQGMIVRRGFRRPPSFHSPHLREAPIGHFFDVITNGFGAMMDYAAQVPPYDRWAIAAYMRALQLSQHAMLADLPIPDRQQLQRVSP
jgi:hypothetical protein